MKAGPFDVVVSDSMPLAVPLPAANRIWVVGNGPSLRTEDLTVLHELGEPSIGMNRIHLAYDKTPWRPDAWCFGDVSGNRFWQEDLLFHVRQGYCCFVKDLILISMMDRYQRGSGSWADEDWSENVVPIPQCKHDYLDVRPPRKWHPPWLCCFSGSMFLALQVAVLSGYPNVVLLGVDHRWQAHSEWRTPDPNHFDPRYDGTLEAQTEEDWSVFGPVWAEGKRAEAVLGHRLAAKEALGRGSRIVNASRSTDLVTHSRADFDELLWQSRS